MKRRTMITGWEESTNPDGERIEIPITCLVWEPGEIVVLDKQSEFSDPERRSMGGGVVLGERGVVLQQQEEDGLVAVLWDEIRLGRHCYEEDSRIPNGIEIRLGQGWWVGADQLAEAALGEEEFGVTGLIHNDMDQ